jgi:arginase
MTRSRSIAIIGAPLDMGPSALRVAGLGKRLGALGYDVTDLGNIAVAQAESLGRLVAESMAKGQVPLVLGGDHSIAAGTTAGVSHADMNTPDSSPSGNVHGMPLACCIGRGPEALVNLLGFSPKVDPSNVALVGIRDVDEIERGMRSVMNARYGSCRSAICAGRRHSVRGGATYREAHLAMELVCDSGRLLSMEVVEVNPVIDEVNRTADLAVELVLSAMGKKIL